MFSFGYNFYQHQEILGELKGGARWGYAQGNAETHSTTEWKSGLDTGLKALKPPW